MDKIDCDVCSGYGNVVDISPITGRDVTRKCVYCDGRGWIYDPACTDPSGCGLRVCQC